MVELRELPEDLAALVRRDTGPRVPDFDAQLLPAAPHADQHATLHGVANRIDQQVLQDEPHQHRIAVHHFARRRDAQRQTARGGVRGELGAELLEQRAEREVGEVHLDRARLEARQIQQLVEHRGQRIGGLTDPRGEGVQALRVGLVAERVGEQAQGMDRLAQVVARSGQEAGLGRIGRDGEIARLLELHPRQLELRGALRHLALERGLGLLQGDVGPAQRLVTALHAQVGAPDRETEERRDERDEHHVHGLHHRLRHDLERDQRREQRREREQRRDRPAPARW